MNRNAVHTRRGFTLLEVMIATIILSAGLAVLLTSFMQCQKVMTMTQANETAQYVLTLGETAYPLPAPDLVSGDPFDDEKLNVSEVSADELLDDLEIDDLPRDRKDELHKYSFERKVDEIDDEDLERSGYLYTVRTTVRWGGTRGMHREEMTLLTLWRKKK